VYPGRTPVLQCVAFQSLQAVLARRVSCERARIVAIRNEKVRGSNPLSSTRETGSDLRKRGSGPVSSSDGMYPLQRMQRQ